jgi:glycosyltransferase involved in cell wall biosynthesis
VGAQLIEAMARGLPIVTLDHHGGAVLVPTSAGVKIPVSNARETASNIARAIELLALDRGRLDRMAEAGVEAARCHFIEKKVKISLDIYRDVLEHHGRDKRTVRRSGAASARAQNR